MDKHHFLSTSYGILLLVQTVASDGLVSVYENTTIEATYISCNYHNLPSGEVSTFTIWQPPFRTVHSDDYYFVISNAGSWPQGSTYHSRVSVSVNQSLIPRWTFSMSVTNMQRPGELRYECSLAYKVQGRLLLATCGFIVKVPGKDIGGYIGASFGAIGAGIGIIVLHLLNLCQKPKPPRRRRTVRRQPGSPPPHQLPDNDPLFDYTEEERVEEEEVEEERVEEEEVASVEPENGYETEL